MTTQLELQYQYKIKRNKEKERDPLYVGYRNFFRGFDQNMYHIYPDKGWDISKWGPKPYLGVVWADEPFYAVREAYTKGLAPLNITFGLIALKEKLDDDSIKSRRYS